MSTLPPILAKLNKRSTEEQIIMAIESVLANCHYIENVSHFMILDDRRGRGRNFLIGVNHYSNVYKVIELLSGHGGNCKSFASSCVLLSIAD
jgi:hypothetical protein